MADAPCHVGDIKYANNDECDAAAFQFFFVHRGCRWGNLASWYSVAHPKTSGINLVFQESERSENAVLVQGVGFADPLCENFPNGRGGWVKQKISMR